MKQLKEDLCRGVIGLTKEMLEEIENIHLSDPNPCV